MAGKFTKTFEGTLMLDFSNVDTRFLSEGTYYVSLISSTESLLKGLSGDATFEDWLSVLQTKDGDGVNFERIFLSGDNKILYAEVSVVPEPSAFAAAFGLLAFVFAVWRRRRPETDLDAFGARALCRALFFVLFSCLRRRFHAAGKPGWRKRARFARCAECVLLRH